MPAKRAHQMSLYETFAKHEIGQELKNISEPKEKKMAKQLKKHNHDVHPFIIPVTTH